MPVLFPTTEEISQAISRAVDHRRAQARRNPRWTLASVAALHERITAYPVKPEAHGFGWWLVGVLVDETDPEWSEYSIMVVPGAATLRTARRYYAEAPVHPKPSRMYYSGATKRWEINPNIPEDPDLPGASGR